MDFLQACYEFHRRFFGTGAADMLEAAIADAEGDSLVLELFLSDDLRAGVTSLRDSGVWRHHTGEVLLPGALVA